MNNQEFTDTGTGDFDRTDGTLDKPEAYDLKRPEMPEGLPYDEESEKALRAWGVKHGVPQPAVAELHEDHNARMLARHAAEIKELNDLWEGVEKTMVDKHGEEEWKRRMGLVKAFFGEWAPKAGFKHEDIVAGLLESKDAKHLTPLMAALAEFVVAQAEGVTKQDGDKIDVAQRWPHSYDVMQGGDKIDDAMQGGDKIDVAQRWPHSYDVMQG